MIPRTPFASRVIALGSILLLTPIIGPACGDPSSDAQLDCRDRPVRMAVASSLREIALALRDDLAGREPPIDIEMIFGASSTLARQLTLGAPIDILVSADASIVDDLIDRGLLAPHTKLEFARGELDLVARAGAFDDVAVGGVSDFAALDSPELRRIAVPAISVPLGRYARSWLADRGTLPRLEGRIVSTEDARATLAAVEGGHVDLAILYRSDALLARRAHVIARIEPSEHPAIRYVGAIATRAAPTQALSCPALGEALGAWSAPATRERLAAAGFLPAHEVPSSTLSSTTPTTPSNRMLAR